MIVNVICALIETFIEIFICFDIFIKAYDRRNMHNKFVKAVVCILLVIIYAFKTFSNVRNLFSISEILIELPVMVITLWIIIRAEFIRIVSWCFFNIINIMLLKLPTLVIIGVAYGESLSDLALMRNSQVWSRFVNCIIFFILYLIYIKNKNSIIKCIKSISYQQAVLLGLGSIEYIIILYIMYIGWHGFTIQTFILTLCLILMLFMFIVCLLILLEYQIIIRMNHLLKSKENSMRTNYTLINHEIERNRKINHDKKYDLEYLYYCFEQKDYENGLNYIKQKENYYNISNQNTIWTGNGSIDFLINRAKARADEKKILFTIKVDIVEIPIEEYDFFSMLSNLLDNAIEASEPKNENERFISLQILSLNNVFRLRLENSYLIEPMKRGKRFISHKDGSTLHGWGIENVKEIVYKYDGKIDINYGNGIFLVDLIMIK